ncbi:imidazolonepropionase [Verminephrobacter eiseniae]|uniref:imidazolonepropionase n=1 Tax=Verminephrobacter eiseniae TaxID=364317 RepID=UPI0022379698|nr:imidazolonepropionase [Verminephrobacter eiseniae]MCW5231494.1 imidazolonepropionase [Verminephrobacter eiseniae]MCW5293223.1 imidazolonepropionase [Verminephrobacter eiseniae]MCW8186609.1 imidazolonepropionase [Verminephrobacter eiseniae]MCW8225066.1 imidazolonepropionase [Verminephrobacter eiseniae]MCW8235128.1 imidazolonepropionase [Verminephrobacter eiseniae]
MTMHDTPSGLNWDLGLAPPADGLWCGLRLVAELTQADQPLPADAPACLVVQGGMLRWVGPQAQLPAAFSAWRRFDARDAARTGAHGAAPGAPGTLATPALVDCHTHLVYGGQRADEFALRLAGASYEALAQAGGGILASVQATRAASEDQLFALAMPRLQALLAEGVGAIEIKSGYGLALEHERKQLRVARRLGQACAVTVRTSFLGAHALPPEYAGRSQDYTDLVCQQMLPALAEQGLVDAVDMFCERIAFTLAETEQVFLAAQQLGLPVKLHAGQLSDMGGAALAARYGALSCDHLEHLSADAIAAMQAAGTVAVLLPGAWYTLRGQQRPPIEALRAAGVPMAVATDHNPGSSPALSLLLMAHMACTLFHLSLSEALAGITTHAARALGLQDSHGLIAAGRPANFVLWPLQEAAELVYWLGHKPACTIVRQGRVVRDGLGLLDRPEMPVLRDGA